MDSLDQGLLHCRLEAPSKLASHPSGTCTLATALDLIDLIGGSAMAAHSLVADEEGIGRGEEGTPDHTAGAHADGGR